MKKRQEIADWSTINLDELRKLPTTVLTRGDRLQDDSRNGCAGDPPGFPTYFTRSICSAGGNTPYNKWHMAIVFDRTIYGIEPEKWPAGVKTWEEWKTHRDALMLKLWRPLPLDHPRTVAWIQGTFKHHAHCYHISGWSGDWHDDTKFLIWPGGCLGKTPFGRLRNVHHETDYAIRNQSFDKWRDEERAKFIADIKSDNERINRQCEAEATPENHNGTILVRRYYPEFQPTPELIAAAFESPGNWWEVMSERPSPDRCPGQYSMVHPCNGSWCQMCGWHAPEKAEAV